MKWLRLCPVVFLLAGAGCGTFGARALERSHGPYNESILRVDEEQFLRNIVRLRYDEGPLTLNVGSIAAQYELSGTAEARPFFIAPNPSNSNVIFKTFTAILPDALVEGANRPTISLDPATDSDSVRSLLTPISSDSLLVLAGTSWPVSTVLRIWVERMNGVPNAPSASGPPRDVPPDFARFRRIAELFQFAQENEVFSIKVEDRLTEMSGPLPAAAVTAAAAVEAAKGGFEYQPQADGKTWALVRRDRHLVLEVNPATAGTPEVAEMEALLNLKPGATRYELIAGGGVPDPLRQPTPPSPVLRLEPRSTAQAHYYLANGVEVPAEHLSAGVVQPVPDAPEITRGLFEVHVCKGHKPPPCAYVAVKYRDYWYYIDDRDAASKATLALMLQLSRLDFARERKGKPLLTLPLGR
jgi:hypothetical protein